MSRWTTRFLAWMRAKLLRLGPRPRDVRLGYCRGNRTYWQTAIPWNADAVIIHASFPGIPFTFRKSDFSLRLPNVAVQVENMRPDSDGTTIIFRFPLPADHITAELMWKGRVQKRLAVDVITKEEFQNGLALRGVRTYVRLAGSTVAANACVYSDCAGIAATALLQSRTQLAPLTELGLHAVFQEHTTGRTYKVPVLLSGEQSGLLETVIAADCPVLPGHPDRWLITWHAGDRELAALDFQVLSQRDFRSEVSILETRFALIGANGTLRTTRPPLVLGDAVKVGPCFVLGTRFNSVAGVCRLELTGSSNDSRRTIPLLSMEVVFNDSPYFFVPSLFELSQLESIDCFELRMEGKLLGIASLRPVPAAAINAEGGFTAPPDFTWTSAAEDELADRLKRLLG